MRPLANQTIIRRWVEALRSGKYKQGRGQLATMLSSPAERAYCCLGVLCELAVDDGVIQRTEPDCGCCTATRYDGETGLPTAAVREWAGVDDWVVRVDDGQKEGLAHINDEYQEDFATIAGLIEKEWLVDAEPVASAPA